jgi:beta-galactosidase GanA
MTNQRKGPTTDPDPSKVQWLYYIPRDQKDYAISLLSLSQEELRSRIHTALGKFDYSPGTTTLDKSLSIKTRLESQEDKTIDNLVVRIGIALEVKMQPTPELNLRYGVAWAYKKEPNWRYDNFPFNLQEFIAAFLKKLLKELPLL